MVPFSSDSLVEMLPEHEITRNDSQFDGYGSSGRLKATKKLEATEVTWIILSHVSN